MARQGLFRDEVIEAKKRAWLGSIHLALPISQTVWAFLFTGFGLLIVAWLALGHYTRREHVSGILVPRDGVLDEKARTAGTVRLAVHEGSVVRRGDILLTISSERVSEAFGDTAANVSTQMRQQTAGLTADILAVSRLEEEQAAALRRQITNLRNQLTEVGDQLQIQRKQAASSQALLDRIKPLASAGYVSAFQIQQQETAALDAEAQLKALRKQQLDTEQQLQNANDQLTQLPIASSSKGNDLKRQLAQVQQSLSQNEADRETEVHAERAGTISSLLVQSGQAVTQGQSLLSLVPDNSPLQAQLLVPSKSAGFVRVGQRVVLRFQPFPYQKFGLHEGRLSSISSSALTASDVTALLGQITQDPYYRVLVDTKETSVSAYGEKRALLPGMAVDADIMLDRRRLFEWLFEPFYGMQRQASGIDQ